MGKAANVNYCDVSKPFNTVPNYVLSKQLGNTRLRQNQPKMGPPPVKKTT